ncbi:MarR family winged helix-turn-helix transcriptional regulator [Microbacterium sp. DT81.1]|uniref:MarR family winged helix-turn-helix transcriptional regulator n=1 Tax=Microbacterium sp. DT81.1 TaxID=3393413 RepID=UPI003CF1F528
MATSPTGSRGREELVRQFFEQIQRNSTWTVIFHQALAVSLGLNGTDLKCRGLLDETGPITAGELAELTGLTTAAVTGVIDRLERAGFVERAKDPADRRRVVVRPLDAERRSDGTGDRFMPLTNSTSALLEGYNNEQLELVLDFVEKSTALMRSQTLALHARKASAR